MASDEEISEGLASLFRETNPNSFTSLNDVILRLQSKLGFDLSNKIDFIRAQITLLFSPLPPPQIPRSHILNPNPNPNFQHHRQHVYNHTQPPSAPSHFPTTLGGGGYHRGPTQISFGQPCAGVVVDSQSPAPAKESARSRPKRRGGAGGLNKLCGVSPLLQTIVGQPTMARTEIVKQLWAYIRKYNLQDPGNKRKIICNDELRLVLETDSTDMFKMNKLLAKHILPLDPKTNDDSSQQSKRLKVEESEVSTTEPDTIVISEALAKLLGTSEKEMLQVEVYKRIEEYIKIEGLEDPLNLMVVCDTKLQELFGCESIPTPGIREALARDHLSQRA